jgi:glutamate synthase domain-containing protein 1
MPTGVLLKCLGINVKCTLQTDTEVITYLFDLLVRKHKMPMDKALKAVAAPFWDDIERESKEIQNELKSIRTVYSSALISIWKCARRCWKHHELWKNYCSWKMWRYSWVCHERWRDIY